MLRKAFVMTLKFGCEAEYHKRHNPIWPELEQVLKARNIVIARRLVGDYITSLEMAGCSITLLRTDGEMLELWDDPVLTAGLRWRA